VIQNTFYRVEKDCIWPTKAIGVAEKYACRIAALREEAEVQI
jgi:hypothetical protein